MRKSCAVVLLMLSCLSSAQASEAAHQNIPNAQLVGEATLSVSLWDIYDAKLYTSNGTFDAHAPYALTLHYLLNLKGSDIAYKSVEEMEKQGFNNKSKLSEWHTKMRDIFPDVEKGTELTAIFIPNKATHFYHDDKLIGSINDHEFTKHFSDIWLGQKTSDPELRKKLLGLL